MSEDIKKIERLTPAQEAKMYEFRDEWLEIGLCTDRVDKPAAEGVMLDFYKRLDEDEPKFVHCESPMAAQVAINKMQREEDGTPDARMEHHSTRIWGSFDAYWVAFYIFADRHLRPMYTDEDRELLEQWEALCKSSGFIYAFKGVCFICDRPNAINKDEDTRLHNETGPSVSFIDGWSLYHWHGVEIPGDWVTGKPPTAKEALSWDNIEQRRAACELLGWVHILDELDAKVLDEDPNPQIGTLLEVDLPDSGRELFLKVQCGTGRDFCLPVDPSIKTALEGNAWTFDVSEAIIKAIEIRT